MLRSTLREMCVKDTIRRTVSSGWRDGCEDLVPLEVSQGGRGLFPLGQFLTQFHGFTITHSSTSLIMESVQSQVSFKFRVKCTNHNM